MEYLNSQTALRQEVLENVIEDIINDSMSRFFKEVAIYAVTDVMENISDMYEDGTLRSVDDVLSYLYKYVNG